MARVLRGFHSFTCTPTRSSAFRNRNEPYLPLQAELAWVAGCRYVSRSQMMINDPVTCFGRLRVLLRQK